MVCFHPFWGSTIALKLKMAAMALTHLCQDYFLQPSIFLYLTFYVFRLQAQAFLQLPLQFKPYHLPN